MSNISNENQSFKEKFLNHVNNNRGKYSALGGVGLTLGGINLAGNGYLGTNAQDKVHDIIYPIAQGLKNNSIEAGTKAKIDPYLDVYNKTDNILNNDQNEKLLATEQILQKENVPAALGNFGEKFLSNLGGLTPNEKLNYLFRNPGNGVGLKIDEFQAPAKGVIDSVSDFSNH